MKFSDEVRIFVRSGDGGNGCLSFRREKFVPRGGPDGGNGGHGGDVVIVADSHNLNLYDLQYRKHFRARSGTHGQGSDCHGRQGADVIVHVPPGTLVYDGEKQEILCDLDKPDMTFVAAKGGRGGRGNASFATSTNRAPRRVEPGQPCEEKWLVLQLKMIADVGLLGFPSAGKSTLISAISNARPKIAAYPFTTLHPNLGMVDADIARRFVVADIPGLIKGAHTGAGLGHKFLRHIERTRILVHMLDMDPQTGRDPIEDYLTINEELEKYDSKLMEKTQVLVANKIDLPETKKRFEEIRKYFRKEGKEIIGISAKDGVGLDQLLSILEKLIPAMTEPPAGEDEGSS
jgi:GTPase